METSVCLGMGLCLRGCKCRFYDQYFNLYDKYAIFSNTNMEVMNDQIGLRRNGNTKGKNSEYLLIN